MIRSLFFGMILLPLLFLAGCVSLGVSQISSEQDYTIAAIAADVFITSGQATPNAVGIVCQTDNANYKILISTRNMADGVPSYAPADNAHSQLQTDGARLSPMCVIPPLKS